MKGKYKKSIMAVCLLFVAVIGVIMTEAYFTERINAAPYNFSVPDPEIKVVEILNSNTKNAVQIENSGTVDAFMRAKPVFTWQNDSGEILGQTPVEGVDYSISWNVHSTPDIDRWVKGSDGFYYYTSMVPGKNEDILSYTDVLFTSCTPLKSAPVDGYKLCVEILSQSYHTYPETEVEAIWPVEVSNNHIVSIN